MICLVCAACRRSESPASSIVQQTIAEARSKPQVTVQIRLIETGLPSAEELKIRRGVEEAIEREHVGTIIRTQSDIGHMDLTIEVSSTVEAIPRIRAILDSAGVVKRSSIIVNHQ